MEGSPTGFSPRSMETSTDFSIEQFLPPTGSLARYVLPPEKKPTPSYPSKKKTSGNRSEKGTLPPISRVSQTLTYPSLPRRRPLAMPRAVFPPPRAAAPSHYQSTTSRPQQLDQVFMGERIDDWSRSSLPPAGVDRTCRPRRLKSLTAVWTRLAYAAAGS
jgi:hypothetical protein